MTDPKATLHRYLQAGRDALLWKLDGLSEYDARRPLTPTGTNLLGLVRHVASVELGYFGATFGRPSNEPLPWFDEGAEPDADMWATAAESREHIVGLYHRAWAHADSTIGALPLDAAGRVPHWPAARSEVTLHQILVHVIAETHRHRPRRHRPGARRRGGRAPRRQRQPGVARSAPAGGPPGAAGGRRLPGRPMSPVSLSASRRSTARCGTAARFVRDLGTAA